MASNDVRFEIVGVDKATDTLKKVQSGIKDTENSVKSATGKIQKFGESNEATFRNMRNYGAIAFGAWSLLTKSIVEAGMEAEQTQVAFKTMFGGGEEGSKKAIGFIQDLTDFAKRTPFELNGLKQNAKQLMAMGIEGDKVISTLQYLGDISSLVGMDKLPNLTYALGQVKAQGKMTRQDLMQFTNAGVGMMDALAKSMGKSKEAINDMITDGQIGFPQVEGALKSLTEQGGLFYKGMEEQSKTVGGQISNLKDSLGILATTIGTALLPIVKSIVDWLNPVVAKIKERVEKNPELARNILIATGAIAGLVMVLGALGLVIGPIAIAIGALTSPIGLVVIAIIALATAVYFYFDEIKAFWYKRKDEIIIVFGLITGPIGIMIEMCVALAVAVYNNFTKIKNYTIEAFTSVKNTILGVVEFAKAVVGSGSELIQSAWTGAMNGIQNVTTSIRDGIKNTIMNGINWVIDQINKLINMANSVTSVLGVNGIKTIGHVGSSGKGSSAVGAWADGGVVTKPSLGRVGEGGMNEAVVPLPNGKSIPVDMKGSQGVTINIGSLYGTDKETALNFANEIVGQFKRQFMFEGF